MRVNTKNGTGWMAVLLAGAVVWASVSPASARTIQFSGYTWLVKNGSGLGPGPNNWSDSTDSVWIDGAGDLHLKVRYSGGTWYCAQVTNQTAMGYGRYEFRIQTNPEIYDPNIVAGLYTYENDYEEIDIEFSQWGDPDNDNAQYVNQPGSPSMKHRFDVDLNGNYSTHIFEWTADAIDFLSLHGHYSSSPPANSIDSWSYTGPDIPTPSGEKVRMNLWLFQGNPPTNNQSYELVIDRFTFTPIVPVPEPATSLLTLAALPCLRPRRRQP